MIGSNSLWKNMLPLCDLSSSATKRMPPHFSFLRDGLPVVRGIPITSGSVYKGLLRRFYIQNLYKCSEGHGIIFIRQFCICTQKRVFGTEGSSRDLMLQKLVAALGDHQVDDAWEAFKGFRKQYGYPDRSVMCKLVTEMSYSVDSRWLRTAYDLVSGIAKTKSYLFQQEALAKLSLSLARAQLPSHATMMLRLMNDKTSLTNVLSLVVLHLVKTMAGTVLASNFLIETCNCSEQVIEDNLTPKKDWKPDTATFNLVLDACVKFDYYFKGQQLIDVMAQRGVVADAHSLVIIAKICEMSGQRDELLKFKDRIHPVPMSLLGNYQHFYGSLLSLHFKYADFEAASDLAIEVHKMCEDATITKVKKGPQKPCLIPLVSQNFRSGLKIQARPDMLLTDTVLKFATEHQLISYKHGRLVLSNRAVAKLIHGYKQTGRLSELSKVVTRIHKEMSTLNEASFCVEVYNACLFSGWLDTCHDIIDDMELARTPFPYEAYLSLLSAYYKRKMYREARGLIHQMKKVGFNHNRPGEQLLSNILTDDNNQYNQQKSGLGLGESLVWETQQEKADLSVLFKFNSSIYFFCKAKMIEDALGCYRRMQAINIQPSVQTFTSLLQGYASLAMYREMTILWDDIKRSLECQSLLPNRDLFEFMLSSFIRGGYFERVMDIINYMKKQNMFIDKQLHKHEFVKLHRDLYKNLKASMARTDAQRKRLNFVQEFRKWSGIS